MPSISDLATAYETPRPLNAEAQDYQDDIDTWGDCYGFLTLSDNKSRATDLRLTPEQVRIVFTALRDHANATD